MGIYEVMMNQKTEKAGVIKLKNKLFESENDEINSAQFSFIDNGAEDSDNNIFLHSLEMLTPDDIAEKKPKPKLNVYNLIFEILRYTLLLICAGVFFTSIYQIAASVWGYYKADMMYSSLNDILDELNKQDNYVFNGEYAYSGDIKLSPTLTKSPETPAYYAVLNGVQDVSLAAVNDVEIAVYNKKLEFMKSKLSSLTNSYPDTYAWIKINNTKIDLPVMQSGDNQYYLDHAYNGDYLKAGAIFADYRCDRNILKNFNTILYGHNMQSRGLMFNNVEKYLDEEFFLNNPYIEMYTTDALYTFEVFSIHEARYDDNYIQTNFTSYEEFIQFAEALRDASMHKLNGVSFANKDHILTLSTCTNGAWYGRYALHAKLIKVER